MPKIITDPKNRILATAKTTLLEKGFDELNMRNIAKACNIASGTIYNYFPSKEMLVGSIMLEDWKSAIKKMEEDCVAAKDPMTGLRAMYSRLTDFSSLYQKMWQQYSFTGSSKYSYQERHKLLRSQLAIIIQTLLQRLGYEENQHLTTFLAENLLAFLNEGADIEPYLQIMAKTIAK